MNEEWYKELGWLIEEWHLKKVQYKLLERLRWEQNMELENGKETEETEEKGDAAKVSIEIWEELQEEATKGKKDLSDKLPKWTDDWE